ncbi:hypothetical protein [Nitrosovibrio tenuis]|uniref:ART-PolyVal-like domain-containing protein n=1 Tax=Nitrosovibrio tenuis TaxID=1233 RepID=A0A1H7NRN3_9PROT|nr:hypothetical protein [Nitrosovibrio tenuis]SEL25687.1 hypothetical protein SAMN05216387_107100 [Nitrosovibrio tenuis]
MVFHETLGHFGLRGAFGEELKPILKQVVVGWRSKVEDKAVQYGLDMAVEKDRLIAAEEVLAELAQTNPQIGMVQRAIAIVRAWLRKNVPALASMKMTDAEIIHRFLIPARRFVKSGKGPKKSPAVLARSGLQLPGLAQARSFEGRISGETDLVKDDPHFSRDSQTDTPAFRKWFKDSKVVDENGEPLVVYHGTPGGGFFVFDPSRSGTRGTYESASLGVYFSEDRQYANTMARST